MPSLVTRLRYRFLSRASLRRTLQRLPLARLVAARHREDLFDMLAGASRQQALLAAHRSGLLDRLADGVAARAEVAAATGLGEDATARLLQWTVAAGLVEESRDARYALTTIGLVAATDGGVRAMIEHGQLLYDDLRDPVGAIDAPGGGRLAHFWPYAGGPGDPDAYSQVMRESLGFVLDPLLEAVDFSGFAHVCELGGGTGQLALALANRTPHLQVTVVELDAVVPFAREAIAAAGMGERVSACPTDEMPEGGADAVLMARLLHDLDDAAALAMLRKARLLLKPEGALIIAEPLARRGRDAQTAYFAAYFAAMGSGRLRRPDEIETLCRAAFAGTPELRWKHDPICSVIQIRHSELS